MPLVVVKIWAGPLVLLFLALQCWTAAAALRDRRPGAAFYALGAAMLLAYLGFFTVSSQVANLVSDQVRGLVLRWGQLVEGAVFAAAVVAAAAPGSTLTIEIRDDGPPIPAETLAALVDDGARGRGSPGQGLGLGIVSELCARNGWRLVLRGDGPGLVARICAVPLAAPCGETPRPIERRAVG